MNGSEGQATANKLTLFSSFCCSAERCNSEQVLLNTRAKRTEEGAWVTCSGKPLAGDVVYQTVGGVANTGFLKGSGVPTDARGFIKVCTL